MVSAPWTNFVHIKQVKQWPELGHFTYDVFSMTFFLQGTLFRHSTRVPPLTPQAILRPLSVRSQSLLNVSFGYLN